MCGAADLGGMWRKWLGSRAEGKRVLSGGVKGRQSLSGPAGRGAAGSEQDRAQARLGTTVGGPSLRVK